MICYEYIGLWFDPGDLEEMNALASTGWKVVAVGWDPKFDKECSCWALLERPLPKPSNNV